VYKIEQHGKISLRRPKLSKEEVKRLMKKKLRTVLCKNLLKLGPNLSMLNVISQM